MTAPTSVVCWDRTATEIIGVFSPPASLHRLHRQLTQQRSGSCRTDGVLQTSDRADHHCYTVGNDGYSWTFLRNVRTNVAGWVRDLLDDGGSLVYCGS